MDPDEHLNDTVAADSTDSATRDRDVASDDSGTTPAMASVVDRARVAGEASGLSDVLANPMNRQVGGDSAGAVGTSEESPPRDAIAADSRRGMASGRAGTVVDVPLDRIKPNPFQPRERFDEEETAELAASIRSKGVLQPVLLRRDGAGFQLIAGERRLRAARRAGLSSVPAIVRQVNDREVLELALIENEQRVDLSPIESARSYARILAEFSLSQVELADVLGRDRSTVSNLLRILRLPDRVQALVHDKRLSMGHARALVTVEEPVRCVAIAERAARLGLPVRAVEKLVQGKARRRPGRPRPDPELVPFEERLRRRFATQVRIRRRLGRGRIEIEFYSSEDLERILEELAVLQDA
jgi:ParB family chromosome partitioning protein